MWQLTHRSVATEQTLTIDDETLDAERSWHVRHRES